MLAPSRFVAALLGITFLALPAFAQKAGEVLWHQKISAAKGGGPQGIRGYDQFGRSSAWIGDLDGDGIGDLVAGVMGDDDGSSDTEANYGGLWVLYMKRDGTVRSHVKISRTSAGLPLDTGDEFGRSVRELGDFDLDGVPDIIVGANYDDDNGTDKGAFYLLFLNRNGTVKSWKKISEISGGFTGDLDPDDQFGRGVRCIGDLDLDGVPDIGVGSIRDDDGGNNRGAYWILFMRRDGTVRSWSKLSETKGNFQSKLSDYGEFGFDCTVLGDRNGDGIQDIAISSPDQSTDSNQQGAVFIVFLNRDGTAKADFRIAENYSGFIGNMLDFNDEFGCCVDTIGDLDNDGNLDIAVGAGKDDDGPPNSFERGAVYILFLNANCTVKGWQKISMLAGRFFGQIDEGDRFGTAVACPGDLNGDGIEDLFVGARFDDDGGAGAGAQYFLALNDGTLVPPAAKMGFTPNRGKAPLDVQFTDQSTGNINGWAWEFGDGTTSSERNPRHTYTATGVKSVTLTVTGPAGGSKKVFPNIIKVDPPVLPLAGFTAAPTLGMAPLATQFADASTGFVTSWSWSFGDGATSTEKNPSHVYEQAGRFDVALTVGNVSGSRSLTRSQYVVVTDVPPPSADFALDLTGGVSPVSVQFSDLSSGDITSWAWSFGDGTSSNLPSPQHTFVQAGAFSVTLTVTGPGGSDGETKNALVTVDLPPAPEAGFTADVTNGIDPLDVSFTDHSLGVVTSWAWSFGDGSTSSAPNAQHTYIAPGVYTVTLVAHGPGGSDDAVQVDLVTVQSVVRGLQDPSFELQTAGGAPAGAWTPFAGLEHVVEPVAGATDGTLPSQGQKWLRVSSAGTANALPPSNPGGAGAPALGGAGVSQPFYLDDPLSVLVFDAAFVRGGTAGDALANDWMSVDVDDGLTSINLYYADAFTPTPSLSSVLGLPRTAQQRVSVDLRQRFPGSTRNTRFTLRIQVGNGGEDLTPSFGLVDGFRLDQRQGSALRYGCGVNPRGSLTVLSGAPRVGTSMVFGVDNPLGTQGPNSQAYLWMSLKPDALFPCGTLAPNLGMSAAGAAGEVLVVRTAPSLVKTITGTKWITPGTPAQVTMSIPANLALIGLPYYVQGYLIDSKVTYGVKTAVTDALKLLVGP